MNALKRHAFTCRIGSAVVRRWQNIRAIVNDALFPCAFDRGFVPVSARSVRPHVHRHDGGRNGS